jgi:hypothetical protein
MYEFSGCPGSEDYQQIADDEKPGDVVLQERPGGLGIKELTTSLWFMVAVYTGPAPGPAPGPR